MATAPQLPPDLAPSQRVQALAALERSHNLFAHRFDGWSTWRVMRHSVFLMAMGLPLASQSRPQAQRIREALLATLGLAWLLVAGRRRSLLVKTCRSALRLRQGDRFRDVYFDGLLEHGGFSCLKLEDINSADFERQAAVALWPADLNPVVFTFWGRVLGAMFPVPVMAFCESVAARLAQEVGIIVQPRTLLMRVSTVHWQARLYSLLLRRVRPRAVLVSDTGDYALRVACSRHNLRFIELQHGVFNAGHPDAVPHWVDGSAAELVLPDVLACYGDFWIDQLAGTRQGRERSVAVGNELIDLARARRLRRRPNDCRHIVLTSQGLDTGRLARWIADMIDQAPPTSSWHLSIKLHPAYDTSTRAYDALRADKRVSVIGGAEQPNVFDLLADADLHLSISSSCHFDAAALGVPTMVVPLGGHELIADAVDGVQILLARVPLDVWVALNEPIDESRSHRFAQPGFVENLRRLLP